MAIKPATTLGRPMSETAYRTLRERVLTCKLTPGARLTERGTAAELGLGLSPVRHALTRLVQDGLVRLTPLEGYRVAPLTVRSVDDLFNVWLLLGPEIARLGVTQAAPEQAAERFSEAVQDYRLQIFGPPGRNKTDTLRCPPGSRPRHADMSRRLTCTRLPLHQCCTNTTTMSFRPARQPGPTR